MVYQPRSSSSQSSQQSTDAYDSYNYQWTPPSNQPKEQQQIGFSQQPNLTSQMMMPQQFSTRYEQFPSTDLLAPDPNNQDDTKFYPRPASYPNSIKPVFQDNSSVYPGSHTVPSKPGAKIFQKFPGIMQLVQPVDVNAKALSNNSKRSLQTDLIIGKRSEILNQKQIRLLNSKMKILGYVSFADMFLIFPASLFAISRYRQKPAVASILLIGVLPLYQSAISFSKYVENLRKQYLDGLSDEELKASIKYFSQRKQKDQNFFK